MILYHNSKNCGVHDCEYYHNGGLPIHKHHDYKQ